MGAQPAAARAVGPWVVFVAVDMGLSAGWGCSQSVLLSMAVPTLGQLVPAPMVLPGVSQGLQSCWGSPLSPQPLIVLGRVVQPSARASSMAHDISQPELFIFITPQFLMFNQFCFNFLKLLKVALLELSSSTGMHCPAEQRCQARADGAVSCVCPRGTAWHSTAWHSQGWLCASPAHLPAHPAGDRLTAHPSLLVASAGRGEAQSPHHRSWHLGFFCQIKHFVFLL